MITRIKISNFKSHLDTDINLSNLNIITGINGVGKSSFIQSLLLLRQSFFKNNLDGLELNNGDLCRIGVVQDAVAISAKENYISFSIFDNSTESVENKFYFAFKESELDHTYLKLNDKGIFRNFHRLSLFNSCFQYLSAYRNGPSDFFLRDTYHVEHLNQISVKEGRAEMIAHYIDYFGKEKISIPELKHPDSKDLLLKTQIEFWLRELSSNINLHVSKSTETSYKIEYSFDRIGKLPTPRYKSKNVGFGLTYDLPLFAAILNSKPNDLIIIENPEAHIHPAAQSKLMELISIAAEAGVQFIIETHSDHIINGTLVATKLNKISPKNIAMYYFDRDEIDHYTKHVFLEVLEGGRIKNAPKGFFDQIDKDLETIMGF